MGYADKQLTIRSIPRMPEDILNRFMRILSIPSTTGNDKMMSIHVVKQIEMLELGYKIDKYGNIIVHRSTHPGKHPAFVSHLDTVHTYRPIKIETRTCLDHTYLTSKYGIGGDDKCGIHICLELLRRLPDITVVFFVNEEAGCVGSNGIDIDEFKNCNCVIGIDRWGNDDYVNKYCGWETTSHEFDNDLMDILIRYEYCDQSGLLTDSLNLAERHVDVPCVNLSCGYYKHHTDDEYIDANETYHCLLLCEEIADRVTGTEYIHKIDTYDKYDWDNPYGGIWDPVKVSGVCDSCGQIGQMTWYDGQYLCDFCRPLPSSDKTKSLKVWKGYTTGNKYTSDPLHNGNKKNKGGLPLKAPIFRPHSSPDDDLGILD